MLINLIRYFFHSFSRIKFNFYKLNESSLIYILLEGGKNFSKTLNFLGS